MVQGIKTLRAEKTYRTVVGTYSKSGSEARAVYRDDDEKEDIFFIYHMSYILHRHFLSFLP